MKFEQMMADYIYGTNLYHSKLDETPDAMIQGEIDVLKMKNTLEATHYYGTTALSRPSMSEQLQTESISLLQAYLIRRAAERAVELEGEK